MIAYEYNNSERFPKGNSKNSNSKIFAEEFVKHMKKPCEIKCIANTADLAKQLNYNYLGTSEVNGLKFYKFYLKK